MLSTGLGVTLHDWWDTIWNWFDTDGKKFGQVLLTLAVALVVWILGRIAISGTIRGIREGVPRGQRKVRRALRRARIAESEPTLEERLETERRLKRATTIGTALRSLLGAVIVIATTYAILAVVGLDVGPLVATAGIVGVALGFGAQSLVKDVLSGMFILLEDQFGVGDVIDVGGASGAVEDVGLRITRMRSIDGTVWFVPNGEIRQLGNRSRLWSRAFLEVRVPFTADLDAAVSALRDAATAAAKRPEIATVILSEPNVTGVEDIGAEGAVVRLLVQVEAGKQWDVMRAIRPEIVRVFRDRGIPLAYEGPRVVVPNATNGATPLPEAEREPAKPRRARGSRS
jgi:small-conductance mechanosensitive channel